MAKAASAKKSPAPKSAAKGKPLTKNELISELATRTGATKTDVEGLLNSLAKVASDNLRRGNGFNVPGIARLKIRATAARPARPGRNPATGESITIAAKPAGKKVVAAVDADLRSAV